MLRFLADYADLWGPLRLFDSITFRAASGMAVAFLLSIFFGGRFIRFMARRRVTEDVAKPDSKTLDALHAGKKGTPTMGGLMLLAAVLLSTALWCDPSSDSLLRAGDLRDPAGLLALIQNGAPDPHVTAVAGRIRFCESTDGRETLARLERQGGIQSPEDVAALRSAVNAILIRADFYNAEAFAGIPIPPAAQVLQGDPGRLLPRHLFAANRALLTAAFPEQFNAPRSYNWLVLTAFGVLLAFGLLGMIDDYAKLRGLGKQGLTKSQKLIVQFLIAGVAAYCFSLQADPAHTTRLLLPFTKWSETQPDLGVFYYVFFAVTVVGCSNAVNLTDGLDGLASGCSIMVCVCYAVLAYVVGNAVICGFFRIPTVPGSGELAILCAIMVGAIMGFLWFNAHPAMVFMGDTGSLAIGAGLAVVALAIKQEIVLILAGGIFVIEAASVVIQVVSYQTTGKRVFKCAPFHHHLEFSGWHENQVVVRFWIVGAILAGLALATLKFH